MPNDYIFALSGGKVSYHLFSLSLFFPSCTLLLSLTLTHMLAFAEDVSYKDNNSIIHLSLDDSTEFPPLNPTEHGWQLIHNPDVYLHKFVSDEDDDDWERIDDLASSQRLYADVVQSSTAARPKNEIRSRRVLIREDQEKANQDGILQEDDTEDLSSLGDDLRGLYKSSNWCRRRMCPLRRHKHTTKESGRRKGRRRQRPSAVAMLDHQATWVVIHKAAC